jgi:hypothetical protein
MPKACLQVKRWLRRRGMKAMAAFHLVELLDASIRKVATEDFLCGDKNRRLDANWNS